MSLPSDSCMHKGERAEDSQLTKQQMFVLQNKKYAENGLDMSKLEFLLHRINRLEATITPVDLDGVSKPTKQGSGEGSVADPIGLQPVGQGVIT